MTDGLPKHFLALLQRQKQNVLTKFKYFKAYPIRIPTKKPPPRIAAVDGKLSMLIF
jgi:hypothetical protein